MLVVAAAAATAAALSMVSMLEVFSTGLKTIEKTIKPINLLNGKHLGLVSSRTVKITKLTHLSFALKAEKSEFLIELNGGTKCEDIEISRKKELRSKSETLF